MNEKVITLRDEKGHWLPGTPSPNPSGGPVLKVSLTKLLQDRLHNEPQTAQTIVNAWIDACKSRDMRALTEMLDRLEGKVASEVNLKALIVNVGDDYAREGIEAAKKDLVERQERYLLKEGEDATKQS